MSLKKLVVEHYQLLTGLIIFSLSLFLIAIKSYFTERGKLRAQISENKKLVNQTEGIKLMYSKELEELKKEHQLEISKRKYQYESKKEQYLRFFKMLDEFSNENNIKVQEKFLPMIEEFNRNYLAASAANNKQNETNAVTVFSKKIQGLMFEANQNLNRVKQETNTIRLIASRNVLQKLDLLTLAYDRSMESSNKMLNELPALMSANNQDAMRANQAEIEITGRVINNIKGEIINLMRDELDEI